MTGVAARRHRPRLWVRGVTLVGAVLVLEGVGTYAIWAVSLARNAFSQGLFHYQDGNYPVLHLAAELLMGSVALAAGIGLLAERRWSRPLALFAFGALAYSCINSAGWPLQNEPMLLAPMALTFVASVVSVPYLLSRRTDA